MNRVQFSLCRMFLFVGITAVGLDSVVECTVRSTFRDRLPMAHRGSVDALSISVDGRVAITASQRVRAGSFGSISGATREAQARFVGAVRHVDHLKVWGIEQGRRIGVIYNQPYGARDICFSHSGDFFATNPPAQVWALAPGSDERNKPVLEIPEHVRHLTFSSDGRILGVTLASGGVEVWDVSIKRRTSAYDRDCWIGFLPDGRGLVTVGTDGTVRTRSVRGDSPPRVLGRDSGGICAVSSAADMSLVVTCTTGAVTIWPLSGTRRNTTFRVGGQIVNDGIIVSRDGSWMAVLVREAILDQNHIELWRAGERAAHMTIRSGEHGPPFLTRWGQFSPDDRSLLTQRDGRVQLWDISTRREICLPEGLAEFPVTAFAFVPRSTLIATGDAEGRVRFWDWARGAERNVSGTSARTVQWALRASLLLLMALAVRRRSDGRGWARKAMSWARLHLWMMRAR